MPSSLPSKESAALQGSVLLVEDDRDVAEVLSLVLGGAGFGVRIARSLKDALGALEQLAQKSQPDVVVADKNLPDGSGTELLAAVRDKGLDAELVLITGYPSLDSAVAALRLGAYDYLEKPFRSLEDVVATVRRAMLLRRTRRERDEARARAVRAERTATLVRVAAGLAHEVKNPLQGIGFACVNLRDALGAVALEKRVREDVFEQLGLVEAEAARLKDLVEGVMDLARPSPRPKNQRAVLELFEHVKALHKTRAEKAGVEVTLEGDRALSVQADEADLTRALDNLLRNALDVSNPGDAVSLGVERVGRTEQLRLWVADLGPGVAPEHRERLFEPFFTTKARGFGLGLCQVAAAAERAGGRVEVSDNQPRGTRVLMYLPGEGLLRR